MISPADTKCWSQFFGVCQWAEACQAEENYGSCGDEHVAHVQTLRSQWSKGVSVPGHLHSGMQQLEKVAGVPWQWQSCLPQQGSRVPTPATWVFLLNMIMFSMAKNFLGVLNTAAVFGRRFAQTSLITTKRSSAVQALLGEREPSTGGMGMLCSHMYIQSDMYVCMYLSTYLSIYVCR